ncbi:MAG: tetratricopeptide repeat protein [Desulfobulbaceae bacterium]|nr:tetratricopeptide repeat protein [Desulfobulbaceae bacterium]HIJ77789.1 tetratricopeptide repeat protein [Deltaproteobacteria bacterium]
MTDYNNSWVMAAEKATNPTTSTLFAEGVRYYRAKDFARALACFQQAEKAGDNRPSLYYNIGVCAFKEGQYPISRQAFLKTAESAQMRPIAFYNLGLVSLKENKQPEAKEWFTQALNLTDDDKLQTLASSALQRMGASNEATHMAAAKYISAGFGHDDNAELASDTSTTSGQGDCYAEALFYFKSSLPQSTFTKNLQARGTLYYQKYFDLVEYDLGMITAGLFHTMPVGNNWQLESGVDYSYLAQDGKNFEQIPSVNLQLKKYLAGRTRLNLGYRLSYLDFLDSQYRYLNGWRQRFEVDTSSKIKGFRLILGYLLELNDRDDDDYSARRHQVKAGVSYTPFARLNLFGGIKYRISDYDYGTGAKREDKRAISTAKATYGLSGKWDAILEYQYTDNDSDMAGYDYTRKVVSLNIARSF